MPETAPETAPAPKKAQKGKGRSPFPPKNRNPIEAVPLADGRVAHVQYDPVYGTYRQVGHAVRTEVGKS